MATSNKTLSPLEVNSDAWKTFVADAMAKHPNRRSNAEREAVAIAMAIHEAEKARKH